MGHDGGGIAQEWRSRTVEGNDTDEREDHRGQQERRALLQEVSASEETEGETAAIPHDTTQTQAAVGDEERCTTTAESGVPGGNQRVMGGTEKSKKKRKAENRRSGG